MMAHQAVSVQQAMVVSTNMTQWSSGVCDCCEDMGICKCGVVVCVRNDKNKRYLRM